jgi:argininosuccinate lyase
LSLEDLQGFSPLVEQDVFAMLEFAAAVARRNFPGGTGPASVAGQIQSLRAWLADIC